MKIPVFSPVSISIIEKMEIDFNISEATYVEKKGARGMLYISPLISKDAFEALIRESVKSHDSKSAVVVARSERSELSELRKPPKVQYSLFVDPPRSFVEYIFKRKHQPTEDRDVTLGFVLFGGVESVDFSKEAPELSKGVFEISLEKDQARRLLTELEKDATKEVTKIFPFEVDLKKIQEYVENHPEIRKILFATSSSYEIREPVVIRISIMEYADIVTQLNGRGPRAEIDSKIAQKAVELEKKGITGIDRERELSAFKLEIQEEVRNRMRRNEKFFGKVAIHVEIENISRLPLKGDIFVDEFALSFPVNFSDYINYSSDISFAYDPVRMKAVWSRFPLPILSEDARGDQRFVSFDLMVPYAELAKVGKISGEIRMWLMVNGNDDGGPPLISFLYPQQICDPRGIPIKEDLEAIGHIDMKSGAYGDVKVEAGSMYKRRIFDAQRVLDFEDKSPRKVYDLVINVLNSMAVEVYYHEEPREVTTIGMDGAKHFHALLRGAKRMDVTSCFIDIVVEGDIFTASEVKRGYNEQVETRRLKHIPREYGNSKITLRVVSSDLSVLNTFTDQIRDQILNQIASIS